MCPTRYHDSITRSRNPTRIRVLLAGLRCLRTHRGSMFRDRFTDRRLRIVLRLAACGYRTN